MRSSTDEARPKYDEMGILGRYAAIGVVLWTLLLFVLYLGYVVNSVHADAHGVLPLAPIQKPAQSQMLQLALVHSVIWLLGLGLIWIGMRKIASLLVDRIDLKNREEPFSALHDVSFGGIAIHDNGLILDCNRGLSRLTGYSVEELVGMDERKLIAPNSLKLLAQNIQSGLDRSYEVEGIRKDGTLYFLAIKGRRIAYRGRSVRVTEFRNISARKLAEGKLLLAANVFTNTREGICVTDAEGTIVDVNEAFSRITGYTRDEVLGRNPRILSSGRHGKEFYAAMWRDLTEKGHWYGEIWNQRKNGQEYPQMATISAVRDSKGVTMQYVALFSDITAFREHEKQLERNAHYDLLTGLANRVLLDNSLHQAMAQSKRRKQRLVVAYVDLDGFKAINDTHGHDVGDQFLKVAAIRMKEALRDGDTIARIGGDEFVAVLLDLADIQASMPILTRLLTAAAQPVDVGGLRLHASASIGFTFYPQAEDIASDQLLRQADLAMYQAKLAGKNRYHAFDAEQDRSVRGHHESLERIRLALAERAFVLYYQPKVNMRTGEIVGAEALIRWQHSERGLLQPAAFLPLIEDHALAIELGEWVIDTALSQIEIWQAAGLTIPVSVNVGARQLQQPNFVERLRAILSAHPNFRPGDLELELLETSALEDIAKISEVIEACREIGITFALDDFGTGYSSLTYLKRLPVTQIKIDQSFVRDMIDDSDDLVILEGVIGLANAFRRQIIAEGVETVEHGEILLQLGCHLAQGYCIARPMPADELPGWSAAWLPDPAWRES